MGQGLGRLFAPDDRDRKFLLPPRPEATEITERYWWSVGVLDQGDEPTCVGFSVFKWLTTGPITNRPPFSPKDVYRGAQANDEWPGEDYDGSSVRGAFKWLKSTGYVTSYRWAFDAELAMQHVLTTGPVVLGTNWYGSMFSTDSYGFLRPRGSIVGGHAYLVVGANRNYVCPDGTKGALRIVNSWGRSFGQKGRAWLSVADADRLIKEDGEAATSDEVLMRSES